MNSLSTQTSSHASQSKNIGAVTLRNSLLSDTKDISRVQLLKEMEFWIDAIKGEECQDERSTNIKNWYEKENALYSYAMPNWGVPPEHTALFREFREDPYYHLKNLVEVVGRTLVEEMLNAE